MDAHIKQEITEATRSLPDTNLCRAVISLSSINSDYSGSTLGGSGDGESNVEHHPKKKQRIEAVFPVGFIEPIRPAERLSFENRTVAPSTYSIGGPSDNITVRVKKEIVEYTAEMEKRTEEAVTTVSLTPSCRQFWKAGDYDGSADSSNFSDEYIDHLRVHPKFLHSNATSHKWALGALAELLDNALDEYCNGATYVHVDVLENLKDKSKMVMVQDNGGGMTPDKMRQCMSLGYSEKGKMANTIGQYGNGFKTSTMRLGADVIVFSRCQGKHGRTSTQSIGLLSFTFLRRTGKEDIVVPMVDYEKKGETWCKYAKSSTDSWQRNLETIVLWSPYESEEHLLQQFDLINEQGTRIIICNLWEDEEGLQELDFDTDSHDIHVRGDDRDYKKIESAKNFLSCRHFLTYRHSLRSYASILYYRIPPGFRIILRGKDVEHHNMINDFVEEKNFTAYGPILPVHLSGSIHRKAHKDNKITILLIGFILYK